MLSSSPAEREVRAPAVGGEIVGHISGNGPPALLLHGGPGLNDYLLELAEELSSLFTVVRYQQRGLTPSVTDGERTVEAHIADAVAVMDSLGWEQAWVIGHSWGGHLAMHVANAHPNRVAGLVVIDPQGAVGDGGEAAMIENLEARLSESDRARRQEFVEKDSRGEWTSDDTDEFLELMWPSYFGEPDKAPPMPPTRTDAEGGKATDQSINDHFAARTLETGLPNVRVPALFIHGERSPIPYQESEKSAALLPNAKVALLAGIGHFAWLERPGSVQAEIHRFLSPDERQHGASATTGIDER